MDVLDNSHDVLQFLVSKYLTLLHDGIVESSSQLRFKKMKLYMLFKCIQTSMDLGVFSNHVSNKDLYEDFNNILRLEASNDI